MQRYAVTHSCSKQIANFVAVRLKTALWYFFIHGIGFRLLRLVFNLFTARIELQLL